MANYLASLIISKIDKFLCSTLFHFSFCSKLILIVDITNVTYLCYYCFYFYLWAHPDNINDLDACFPNVSFFQKIFLLSFHSEIFFSIITLFQIVHTFQRHFIFRFTVNIFFYLSLIFKYYLLSKDTSFPFHSKAFFSLTSIFQRCFFFRSAAKLSFLLLLFSKYDILFQTYLFFRCTRKNFLFSYHFLHFCFWAYHNNIRSLNACWLYVLVFFEDTFLPSRSNSCICSVGIISAVTCTLLWCYLVRSSCL